MGSKISYFLFIFAIAFIVPQQDGDNKNRNTMDAADHIIDFINNCRYKTKNKINFSNNRHNRFIDEEHYNIFIISLFDQLGRVIAHSPPSFLSARMSSFQIFAEKGRWTMIVGLAEDGSISYLRFVAPAPIIQLPERNSTKMRLPFRGEWVVVQGGPTPAQNSHIETDGRASRFAIDFSMEEANGQPFRDDGGKLEDYTSFGGDILAVADGEVVTVVDGTPDNRPFTVNPTNYAGNFVIIKHKICEFSRYSHLKMSSMRLKVGQKVSSGQVIGQCGNSGFSSLPHLHFDTTNSEVTSDATGFMPYFQDVIVRRNGSPKTHLDYTPLRDDYVRTRE